MWMPPVLRTVALDGRGVAELVQAIDRHAVFLKTTGEWQRRDHTRLEVELETRLTQTLLEDFRGRLEKDRYKAVIQDMVERRLFPRRSRQIRPQFLTIPLSPDFTTTRPHHSIHSNLKFWPSDRTSDILQAIGKIGMSVALFDTLMPILTV